MAPTATGGGRGKKGKGSGEGPPRAKGEAANAREVRIQGTCEEMCPAKEIEIRMRLGDIDKLERFGGFVKRFARTIEPEPALFRTRAAIAKTANHLLYLMDNAPEGSSLKDVHRFLWDRYRGLRTDLTVQHMTDEFAVTLYEQMARFHIFAEHELCEEAATVTDTEGFDSHLNIEQLQKCFASLFSLYAGLRDRGRPQPNEAEFRCYFFLLTMGSHGKYGFDASQQMLNLSELQPDILGSAPVQAFLAVNRAYKQGNYVGFFRLVRAMPYLSACLLHAYFVPLWGQALQTIMRTFQPRSKLQLQDLCAWLMVDNLEDAALLAASHGLQVDNDGGTPHFKVEAQAFQKPEGPVGRKKSSIISGKRAGSFAEACVQAPSGWPQSASAPPGLLPLGTAPAAAPAGSTEFSLGRPLRADGPVPGDVVAGKIRPEGSRRLDGGASDGVPLAAAAPTPQQLKAQRLEEQKAKLMQRIKEKEEEERRRAEAEAQERLAAEAAEAERLRKQQEEERRVEEERARRKAEEEEAARRAAAAAEARRRAEEDARRAAEEAARRQAEAERARRRAKEEEARRRQRALEEQRRREEEERQRVLRARQRVRDFQKGIHIVERAMLKARLQKAFLLGLRWKALVASLREWRAAAVREVQARRTRRWVLRWRTNMALLQRERKRREALSHCALSPALNRQPVSAEANAEGTMSAAVENLCRRGEELVARQEEARAAVCAGPLAEAVLPSLRGPKVSSRRAASTDVSSNILSQRMQQLNLLGWNAVGRTEGAAEAREDVRPGMAPAVVQEVPEVPEAAPAAPAGQDPLEPPAAPREPPALVAGAEDSELELLFRAELEAQQKFGSLALDRAMEDGKLFDALLRDDLPLHLDWGASRPGAAVGKKRARE